MSAPLQLAVLVASTREGRFADTISNWFVHHACRREDLRVDVVDLAEARLPATLTPRPTPEVERFAARLDDADAFVVITPEYNHSFPAPLKQAIDLTASEWHAKPVGFVSYGGISGGLRAVEQLRPVFAERHAVTVRETVSFHRAWARFDAHGQPMQPEGPNSAAKRLLDQLTWWARALRDARAERPYAA